MEADNQHIRGRFAPTIPFFYSDILPPKILKAPHCVLHALGVYFHGSTIGDNHRPRLRNLLSSEVKKTLSFKRYGHRRETPIGCGGVTVRCWLLLRTYFYIQSLRQSLVAIAQAIFYA
jgi:hypothetical protein